MRTLATALMASKNRLTNIGAWVWLFQLRRDSTNVSYYAQNNADVSFDSITYTHKNIRFEPVSADMSGTTADFSITIGDADKTEIGYLLASKYINQPAVAYLANLDYLSETGNKIQFRGIILSADTEEGAVTLHLGSYDLRNTVIPRSTMFRTTCRYEFKGPCSECAYAGATTTCAKTKTACAALSNSARFGGAPGIPTQRP